MENHVHVREKVLDTARQFLDFTKEYQHSEAHRQVKDELERYQLNLFRLVVIGEIKKGKSSFINALLGVENLLPTSNDIATSTVFKIMYGAKRRIKVFFAPGEGEDVRTDAANDEAPEPIVITPDELHDYGTEDGNPDNRKRVDFIAIELPHPLLRQGLVIVDTPGLGGLFRKHGDITWRYIPNADAVFFIVDSAEAVMSRDECDFLERLRRITPLLFFVQTKTDLVSEGQKEQWKQRNMDIIAQKIATPRESLLYFPVSAKLKSVADRSFSAKHLARSGFPAVMDLIQNRLMAIKGTRLSQVLLKRIQAPLSAFRAGAGEELRIANESGKEGLDCLDREYREAQKRFAEWEREKYPEEMDAFRTETGLMQFRIRTSLTNALDPSVHNTIIRDLVERAAQEYPRAQELCANAGTIQQRCADQCMQIHFDTMKSLNAEIDSLIARISGNLGVGIGATMQTINPSAIALDTSKEMRSGTNKFGKIQSAYGGAMFGGTIAWLPVYIMFPPAAGVAAIVGLLYGGIKSYKQKNEQEKEAALKELEGLLCSLVREANKHSLQQFQEIILRYEAQARETFKAIVKTARNEINGKLDHIQNARNRTAEESRIFTGALQVRIERLDRLLAMVSELLVQTNRLLTVTGNTGR